MKKILINRYFIEGFDGEKFYTENMKGSNHTCVFEERLNALIAEGYKVVAVDYRKKYAKLEKEG